ncbi:MAG: hypothetical protein NWR43_00720 [Alphaproteobacteria bacterium]|nr:hypothetical protein [Alphaproteobacteria bacterium]
MSCYHHQEAAAVAHCSFCSKHLCKDCVKIQSDRTVCEDPKCAEGIDILEQITKRSAKIYNINGEKKRVVPWTGLVFILFGIILAFYSYFSTGWIDVFVTILCALLIIIGILMIIRARKWGMNL